MSGIPKPPGPPPPFLPPDEQSRRQYEWPIMKVQATVLLTFSLLGFTVLFGLLRSRVNSTWMKTLATILLFPLSNKLISFVPGLMELNHKYDLFVLWLSFLTYLGAVANNYSCYRFGDNEDRKISLFMDNIFPWGTIVFSLCKELIGPEVFVPVLVMFWMVLFKFKERRDALSYATRTSFGLVKETKVVYDFMNHQRNSYEDVEEGEDGVQNIEPNFKFLVGVREARSILDNEDCHDQDDDDLDAPNTGLTPSKGLLGSNRQQPSLVTLDKIMDQREKLQRLLSTPQIDKLQNTCFSFALFWILLAKVAGHDVRTEAYSELIESSNTEPIDCKVKRIFDIIDVEIDFLYQYFYTNYYAIYVKGIISKFWHLFIVAFFFWLTLPLLVLYRPEDHSVIYVDIHDHVLDKGITRFIIIVILVFELVHICLVLTSRWAKVIYLCDFVQKKPTSKITELAIKYSTRLSFSFGRKEVAQYSLGECYNSTPPMMWLAYFIQEIQVMNIPQVGQYGIKNERLVDNLKKPFITFILKCKASKNNMMISNGVRALKDQGAGDELIEHYIHYFDSHSEVILAWHLATYYLDYSHKSSPITQEEEENKRIAIILSQYCAYLVVFATRFLPDSGYVAQCVFKRAVKELKSISESEEELNHKQSSKSGIKLIKKKAKALKDEIEMMYNGRYWKLLVNFWTEMLLYISLANNFETIEAHADYLCTGGELITHLWALVNHAGCIRDPTVKPKTKTREDE